MTDQTMTIEVDGQAYSVDDFEGRELEQLVRDARRAYGVAVPPPLPSGHAVVAVAERRVPDREAA